MRKLRDFITSNEAFAPSEFVVPIRTHSFGPTSVQPLARTARGRIGDCKNNNNNINALLSLPLLLPPASFHSKPPPSPPHNSLII